MAISKYTSLVSTILSAYTNDVGEVGTGSDPKVKFRRSFPTRFPTPLLSLLNQDMQSE